MDQSIEDYTPSECQQFQRIFPSGDILFLSEVIRRQVGKVTKIGYEFLFLGIQILGARAPEFLTQFFKLHSLPNTWESLVAISRWTCKIKLTR